MDIAWFVVLAAFIFCIGAAGVLTRRNPLVILLCLRLSRQEAFAKSYRPGPLTADQARAYSSRIAASSRVTRSG